MIFSWLAWYNQAVSWRILFRKENQFHTARRQQETITSLDQHLECRATEIVWTLSSIDQTFYIRSTTDSNSVGEDGFRAQIFLRGQIIYFEAGSPPFFAGARVPQKKLPRTTDHIPSPQRYPLIIPRSECVARRNTVIGLIDHGAVESHDFGAPHTSTSLVSGRWLTTMLWPWPTTWIWADFAKSRHKRMGVSHYRVGEGGFYLRPFCTHIASHGIASPFEG